MRRWREILLLFGLSWQRPLRIYSHLYPCVSTANLEIPCPVLSKENFPFAVVNNVARGNSVLWRDKGKGTSPFQTRLRGRPIYFFEYDINNEVGLVWPQGGSFCSDILIENPHVVHENFPNYLLMLNAHSHNGSQWSDQTQTATYGTCPEVRNF